MVENVIARLVGATPDVDDLVQTTFVEALRHFYRFRGQSKVSTWLCGIAAHVASHHLRASRIRRHVPLESPTAADGPAGLCAMDATGTVEQRIDGPRLATRMQAALDRIGPQKSGALLLYVLEELRVRQIAAIMNATETATRSRLFHARQDLQAELRRDPGFGALFEMTPSRKRVSAMTAARTSLTGWRRGRRRA